MYKEFSTIIIFEHVTLLTWCVRSNLTRQTAMERYVDTQRLLTANGTIRQSGENIKTNTRSTQSSRAFKTAIFYWMARANFIHIGFNCVEL